MDKEIHINGCCKLCFFRINDRCYCQSSVDGEFKKVLLDSWCDKFHFDPDKNKDSLQINPFYDS